MVKPSVFTRQPELHKFYLGSAAFNLSNDALSGARGNLCTF